MFSCTSCQVTFDNGEAFRQHYGSEWHNKNVRRRVDGQRPLSLADFSRSSQLAGNEAEAVGVDVNGAPVFSCTLCKKTFRSVQTLQTHVRSTAHLIRKEQRIIARDSEAASMLTMTSLGSAAMGLHRRHNAKRSALKKAEVHRRADAPKVCADDREADTSDTRCVFCGHPSDGVEANVEHMRRVHDFAIPMESHCTDRAGLLSYLARKVNGLVCLVCNEKTRSFASLEALRDHMREADHERILLNPEYQEFYNCALADPAAMKPVERLGLSSEATELVLVPGGNARGSSGGSDGGKKRVLLKREVEVPRPRPRETPEQTEKRKAILSAEHQALVVAKQEQRTLMAARNKEEAKQIKRSGGEFQEHQLRVNLRSNKLHPKGYDGDGVMN